MNTKHINVDPKQLMEQLQTLPKDRPITMLNLLRFRKRAQYQNGDSELSGREAYTAYLRESSALFAQIDAQVIFQGEVALHLIADPQEAWDKMLLVRYTSVAEFISFVTNPDYRQISHHRTAALDDSRLIAIVEAS